jgi:hypothetical protein
MMNGLLMQRQATSLPASSIAFWISSELILMRFSKGKARTQVVMYAMRSNNATSNRLLISDTKAQLKASFDIKPSDCLRHV